MRLTKGTRLGPYEILEPLGQGGMGEVYRARDERLHRDIAVKVIHPELVTADSLGRFRREARVLAALSHPNVANVYELDEVDGTAFLVMEIVSGDTLADRLAGGPLPIPDVFRIAGQVAAALEAVHDKGIVHRDLKPSNIKVTRDGLVKVLDFGLAKPVVENAATRSHLATATVGATREGLVVGTAAYMSPEQVRGWEIDRRTDVWAFGCVLYEMLTGRPAFSGDSVADTIAAVIERDLDWGILPPSTPPGLMRLLRRCVQRDLKRRLRDMGDARLDLEEAASDSPTRDRPAPTLAARGWRTTAALMAGLLTLGVLLGAAAASYRSLSPRRAGAPAHFVVPLSPTTQLSGLDFPSVAISPDGSRLAFVGSRGGQTLLFVRQMNALDSTALPGTTNAVAPFFSPDGSWIAFFADGRLKKVALSGGMPITLCEAQVGLGGSWGADDRIVFASNTGSGLSTVSADGGRPQRVTNLDATKGEFSHRWPEWLPGGESVIYTVGTVGTWNQAEIVAQSLTTGERSVLVQGGTNPHYLPTGHLVYAHDGRIFAVPFDPRRLRVTGAPAPVLENVLQSTDGAAQFGVSQAGMAAYVSGELAGRQGKLVSVTRDGAVMPFAGIERPVQLAAGVGRRRHAARRSGDSGLRPLDVRHQVRVMVSAHLRRRRDVPSVDAGRTGGIQLDEERAAEPVHQRRLATRTARTARGQRERSDPGLVDVRRIAVGVRRAASGHGTRHVSPAARKSRGTTAADLARRRERSALLAEWPLARVRVERVRTKRGVPANGLG